MTEIVTPVSAQSEAIISQNGQIAGFSQTASGQSHPFFGTGTAAKDLGVPSGFTECTAVAINGNGDLAGTASANNNAETSHAVLYHVGTWTDLGTLGTGYSQAEGLNDLGQVTGSSGTISVRHAFLYSQGTMQDLGALPGYIDSQGNAVSNEGAVVGSSAAPVNNGAAPPHAFIYAKGQMQDLNMLLPAGSGWVLQSANAINDAGQIVGDGLFQGQDQAFLMTPAS